MHRLEKTTNTEEMREYGGNEGRAEKLSPGED